MSDDWIAEYLAARKRVNPHECGVEILDSGRGWYELHKGRTTSWRKYRRADIERMTRALLARLAP